MRYNNNINYNDLWLIFSKKRWLQFKLLILLMGAASIAEIFTIGSVIPFLAALTNKEKLFNYLQYFRIEYPFLIFFEKENFVLILSLGFIISIAIAGLIRLILSWASIKFSFGIGSDLSTEIFKKVLYQPYLSHLNRNSSELIVAIANKTSDVVHNIIQPIINILNALITLCSIFAILLLINIIMPLILIFGFGGIYILIIKLTKKKLESNGRIISGENIVLIKLLQEGLGGIRDVILDRLQKVYLLQFKSVDASLRKARQNNQFIGIAPRFIVETLAMIILSLLAYFITTFEDEYFMAIPIIGAATLVAQRILPLLQHCYNGWASINGSIQSLIDILDLIKLPLPNYTENIEGASIKFNHIIKIDNISFRYEKNSEDILKSINLDIRKGDRIGIMGATGDGKSTLSDIIMGLLNPTSGRILVDGHEINDKNRLAWQKQIAHVPQSIYLSDATIQENIAFGVPKEKIDLDRVILAAKQSQLDDTIVSWPNNYFTIVGERGARLSGGQRQRIGLARALYKGAKILILDEATSALDNNTEEAVLQCINQLDNAVTIIIIAHRLSTLKICNKIVKFNDGKLLSL